MARLEISESQIEREIDNNDDSDDDGENCRRRSDLLRSRFRMASVPDRNSHWRDVNDIVSLNS